MYSPPPLDGMLVHHWASSMNCSSWMGCQSITGLPPAQEYYYSPLDGMLVHHRVTPSIGILLLPPGWDASPSQGYPQHRNITTPPWMGCQSITGLPPAQEYYYSPLDGMLVHHRVTPSIGILLLPPGWDASPSQGYPQHRNITTPPWMGCQSITGLPPAQEYYYSPLDGMLVYHWVTPSIGVLLLPPGWDASPSQGYPQHRNITTPPWMGCQSITGLPPAQEYYYSPLDGMLVHHRVTPSIGILLLPPGWDASLSLGYPQHRNITTPPWMGCQSTTGLPPAQEYYYSPLDGMLVYHWVTPSIGILLLPPGWDASLSLDYPQHRSITTLPWMGCQSITGLPPAQEYYYSPLDGMLVHHRVTSSIGVLLLPLEWDASPSQGYPQHRSITTPPWMGCQSITGLPPAQEYYYSPLNGMLVHHRVTPSIGVLLLPPGWDASPSQGYPQHRSITTPPWMECQSITGLPPAQEYYYSPLDGMLVHHRVTPSMGILLLPPGWNASLSLGYPQHRSITTPPWMECQSITGLPLAQEYYYSPLDGMLVYHWVTPSIGVLLLPPGWNASPSQGYPQHRNITTPPWMGCQSITGYSA